MSFWLEIFTFRTPEGPPHTFYGGSLADFFRLSLGNRALVREAHPITLEDSEPEPDIAIVRGGWANYRLRHPRAEEIYLVVEISESSLVKDLERKKLIYATPMMFPDVKISLTQLFAQASS